jgi:hypothetical protein
MNGAFPDAGVQPTAARDTAHARESRLCATECRLGEDFQCLSGTASQAAEGDPAGRPVLGLDSKG